MSRQCTLIIERTEFVIVLSIFAVTLIRSLFVAASPVIEVLNMKNQMERSDVFTKKSGFNWLPARHPPGVHYRRRTRNVRTMYSSYWATISVKEGTTSYMQMDNY